MKFIVLYIPIFLLLFLTTGELSYAQNHQMLIMQGRILDGDTMLYKQLPAAEIFAFRIYKSKRQQRKHEKLVRNVKKAYPYARLAGIKMQEYNQILAKLPKEADKKRVMRKLEKELQKKFGKDLRKLTFSQGRILIKLIDRETGKCSYEILQEFRGNFTAFFYQSFARVFSYNLKTGYSPQREDKEIEQIVQQIEQGIL